MYPATHNRKPFHYFRTTDLNCALAQGWGPYTNASEDLLLPHVKTVFISCGAHAGDPSLIIKALKKAKAHDLAVGAHLGYPDLITFGRRELRLDHDELSACIQSQLGLLAGLAQSLNMEITHFKPQGALYNKASVDSIFTEQLARIAEKFSRWLTFVGPASNHLQNAGELASLQTAGEVYLDKFYRKDGSLYKSPPNKPITLDFCLSQARSLLETGRLIVEGGKRLKLSFKTINLNLDHSFSLELAQKLHQLYPKSFESLDNLHRIKNFQVTDLRQASSLTSEYAGELLV